jgi:hypothetical protein
MRFEIGLAVVAQNVGQAHAVGHEQATEGRCRATPAAR